jgi:hypothetical protein
MKTRKELEEMGLAGWSNCMKDDGYSSHLVNLVIAAVWAESSAHWAEQLPALAKVWDESGRPIFDPGHEPVSKEGRALLRHLSMTQGVNYDQQIRDYRDSLKPVDVVPDGWERTCADGYKKGPAKIAGIVTGKGSISIQIDLDDCWSSTFYCVDTLPEAFAAAESMMERLGLITPEPDANPWHKTDGMAPPKEAGDRVIETVDGRSDHEKGPATSGIHCWGSSLAGGHPIKWRYADGGGE